MKNIFVFLLIFLLIITAACSNTNSSDDPDIDMINLEDDVENIDNSLGDGLSDIEDDLDSI